MQIPEKKLPIGIEDFEVMIKDNFYYVDKTGFITELLHNWGAVNLFTRPRRFGKSLNMNMLEHFFSTEGDKSIFDGLEISKETELCEEHILKYGIACYKKRCKVMLAVCRQEERRASDSGKDF